VSEHIDYDSLRADTVRQVAAAAITAPKVGRSASPLLSATSL